MAKTKGWVKIHRKILATKLTSSQFKFFVGVIILAKTPKSPNSGLVDLSVRQLADELHMSRSEVWRREKELEAMGMLTLLAKGFVINNYVYYQTSKSVPPTGQAENTKAITTVPLTGHQSKESVPHKGQSVPPTGRSVPHKGQSVPSHETKSTHKKYKNNKNHKNIRSKKKRYGEFNNVLLTDEEYQKLEDKFGANVPDMIETLSSGIESKGYKYQSHYAAILSWERRERKKGGQDGTHRQSPRPSAKNALKGVDIE